MHHKCKIKKYRHFSLRLYFPFDSIKFHYLPYYQLHTRFDNNFHWQLASKTNFHPQYVISLHIYIDRLSFFYTHSPTSITPSTSNNNSNKKKMLRTAHPYSFIIAKGWIDEW